MKHLVISYVPLLQNYGNPLDAQVILDPENAEKYVEHVTSLLDTDVHIQGCAWADEEGEIHALLITDKAKEIRDHLLAWCEEKPQDWFRLEIKLNDVNYQISLIPDLEKSAQRYRTNRFIHKQEHISKEDVMVYGTPLQFHSTTPMRAQTGKPEHINIQLLDQAVLQSLPSDGSRATKEQSDILEKNTWLIDRFPVHWV